MKVLNFKGKIETDERFSYSFMVFLVSYSLSIVYLLFWIIRIGSVVRLRVVR